MTVNIQNFAFDPPEVTAAVGETIGWTNADAAPHTATTDDGGCDAGNIARTRPPGSCSMPRGRTRTTACPPEYDGHDHDPVAVRPVRARLWFSAPR